MSENQTNINWYPGHMTKAVRMMQEDIKLIDLVIELIDARVPFSSKNPDIDKLANGKYRMILLNKADLADPKQTKLWQEYYEAKGFSVYPINARSGDGMKQMTPQVLEVCKEKIERDRKRGILNRPIRAMIVGIPNVGKSTFINSYAKKAMTKTGNKPGVTKGKQWIKISKQVEVLDTPGILWPKFEDIEVGKRLAMVGSIRDEILNMRDLSCEFIETMIKLYPGVLASVYEADESLEAYEILNGIAVVRGCKKKGDEPDLDKAAAIVFENYRNGKLGRITLETPEA